MADYMCTARSNYFEVGDDEAFKAFMEEIEGVTARKGESGWVVLPDEDSYPPVGVPSSRYNAETEEYEDIDFFAELAPHLKKDEVFVYMEAGAEKFRYVCGMAWAVHSDGRVIMISIGDIYQRVVDEFGIKPTEAVY